MGSVFFTGFPGFLGVELLPRILLDREADTQAHCLVQSRYVNYAKKKLRDLEETHPELTGRIHLHLGDVAHPALAIETAENIRKQTSEVYHLAAAYDLSIGRDMGRRVNVDGTRHVIRFAQECPNLQRFHHVSSCYVSGRHPGLFRETDLEVGQTFNNACEETLFEAEVSVSQAKAEGLPVTIYRPSMIVGDSQTGATQKFDGIYFTLRWILTMPRLFAFPAYGKGQSTRVNIVPRDFVVDAIAHLSSQDASAEKTYHLVDPRPLKAARLVHELGRATGRTLVPVPLPKGGVQFALRHSRRTQRWMQMPPQILDYFTHPTLYSAENSLVDLKGSGISCPHLVNYLPTLVKFMREHGEITSRAMI